MLRHVLPTLACLTAALAGPVQAADINFCWIGANGYTMTGRMEVPDALMTQAVVTEDEITAFKIAGYHDGKLLGTWDMADRAPGSTWHLRFDPVAMEFLTGGSFRTHRSQGWNADGQVRDCGMPGFGFNSGNFAQDICVNGTYIRDSAVAPDTPFLISSYAFTPNCEFRAMTSKLPKTNHSD